MYRQSCQEMPPPSMPMKQEYAPDNYGFGSFQSIRQQSQQSQQSQPLNGNQNWNQMIQQQHQQQQQQQMQMQQQQYQQQQMQQQRQQQQQQFNQQQFSSWNQNNSMPNNNMMQQQQQNNMMQGNQFQMQNNNQMMNNHQNFQQNPVQQQQQQNFNNFQQNQTPNNENYMPPTPNPMKSGQMTATQAMSSYSDFAKQKMQENQQQSNTAPQGSGWSSIDVEQNVTPSAQNSQSPWMENSKRDNKPDQTGWGNSTQTSNPWFSQKEEVKNNNGGNWNPNKNIGW